MNYDNNHKNGSSNKKKNKKPKRVLLLRNPFSDSESSTTRKHEQKNQHNYFSSSEPGSPSAFGLLRTNPLSDSRAFLNCSVEGIGNGDKEDDNDDEEDEERTVQARRGALATLDPYCHESINAEFKSLKVPVQPTEEAADVEEPLTDLEPMELDSDEILGLYAQDKFAQAIVSEVCTPRSSFNNKCVSDSDSINSTPRMVALDGKHVPDIAISFATPSPPSKPTHRRRGSSIARNSGLLSATFLPSPLSLTSEEPSLVHDSESDGIHPVGFIKGPSKRSSAIYRPFFSRITGPSVTSVSTAGSTGNVDLGERNNHIEDHIGVEINKCEGPESRRNTLGAPVQPRFTVQQGQFTPQQQEQKSQAQVPRPLVPKRPSTKWCKQGGRRGNLDPWDSCDDMLIQATDDEDDHFFGSGISNDLKGKIGGRRRSNDECDDGTATADPSLLGGRFGRGVVDDWIVHPRTTAIRGTYDKVHDIIPVPKNSGQQAKPHRPLSSSSDYTTISLASPPMTNRGATGLSRAGSLDSSFCRLKRGAASLLMGFGPQPDHSRGLEKKNQDLDGDDQMQGMMSGHGNYNQDNRNQRSSPMSFGPHKTVTPPLANFSSFSSFQSLLSNPKPSSNNSPPPFSPNSYLRRAQTTLFAESHLGTSSGSRVSLSPISNRKTPAMMPTIVIPQNLQHERSALTATTVRFGPSSGYSDTTMTMAFDDDEQYRPPRRFVDQDGYSKGMESPTLTIQSVSSSDTFQRLLPQRDDRLKVPEPKAAARNNSNQPVSLAASAMAAAQRARSQGFFQDGSTTSNDSVDFAQDDYIGQFERERARARGDPAASMSSFGSLATTMHNSLSAGSSNSTLHYPKGSGMMHNELKGFQAYVKERTSFGFGFLNGSRRERRESNQSDVTEKLMHLPEPSRFEGMCSCRGIFNISSMLLILLGLVLLILGYPIASSLKKERMEAEAAAAALAAATDTALKAKMNSTSMHFEKFNMDNSNNNASVALPSLLGDLPGIGRGDALVDPETPLDKRSKTAYDGTQWSLVFSDEFNQEGRSFGPGQDPYWEAIDLAPSTGSLEGYKQDAVQTNGGHLEITLDRTPVPAGKQRKRQNYQDSWMFTSGMLQSWNKMCIQGGLVEVAVSLPGNPSLPGLKPRVFLLGNLARYGYKASMDGVYPYSYSECDESSVNGTASTGQSIVNKQRLSACSNIQGGVGVGRGAPEISLLETHYGIQTEPSAVEAQKQAIQQQRLPSSLLRKRKVQERSTIIIEKQRLGTSRVSVDGSGVNSVDSGKVLSIAISSVKVASPLANDSSEVYSSTPQWIQPLDNNVFESIEPVYSQYVKVGVEYSPGSLSQVSVETKETAPTAYAQFQMNDQWQDGPLLNQADYQLVSAQGGEDRWRSAKSLGSGQIIPQEPMSMVLSLGLLQDEILLHPDIVFPAVMRIDYVRVYHPDATGTRSMSCDPVDHPTAEYIRSHPRAYQESTLQTWAEAGYA